MVSIRESELHLLGKAVFDDAVGQDICLPGAVSPLFTPPLKHRVTKVELEKELPFAGHNGRRADVVLTSAEGVRIIVEVKYSNGKGMGYGFDVARAGNWLAVELDVARWKDDVTLLPDFSKPGMLQRVLNQVTWLNPGTPSLMEWMPYSQEWRKRVEDNLGQWHELWYEEHGWVLHRDGVELREYRIRQPGDYIPKAEHLHLSCCGTQFQAFHHDNGQLQAFYHDADGFQAFHVDHVYAAHDVKVDIWAGPVRALWKDAVKDLFGYRAPGAEPIF